MQVQDSCDHVQCARNQGAAAIISQALAKNPDVTVTDISVLPSEPEIAPFSRECESNFHPAATGLQLRDAQGNWFSVQVSSVDPDVREKLEGML
jgi:hypothetical protein